jgi:hypothetical protein
LKIVARRPAVPLKIERGAHRRQVEFGLHMGSQGDEPGASVILFVEEADAVDPAAYCSRRSWPVGR